MKPYLAITGTLFGGIAAFHVWATLTALNRLSTEPDLVVGRATIAVAAGVLSLWAWRFFRSSGRTPVR
jgi:hypothetical protein